MTKALRGQVLCQRPMCAVLPVVLAVAAASMMGTAATMVVASAVDRPAVFVSAGVAVASLAAVVVVHLLSRRRTAEARRRRAAAAAVTVAALLTIGWLTPLHDVSGSDPTLVQYWQITPSERLAYTRVAARTPVRRPWPIVVLHGGPGIPELAADRALWGQLADDGFDVILYQQLGAGRSSRLADPRGYGLARDLADLDQIQSLLGADRLILVGHSYGATLATAYLAAHPDRVAQLVLTSPGPLNPADHSSDQAATRLSSRQRAKAYALTLPPRPLLGYLLLQVNPVAAHAFLPDAEADRRNDKVLTAAQTGLVCSTAAQSPVTGSGFYRLQYPQSATAPAPSDLRPAVTGLGTPTLIFKGGCDYLSWSSVQDYRHTLTQATLVYLPEAGHDLSRDQPGVVLNTTRAFLTGRPLPVTAYHPDDPPPTYQNPAPR